MIDFKVGEHEYTASRLDAFTQLHIGRRMSPLLSQVTAEGGTFSSIALALSRASQADIDYILKNTLKVVKRKGAVMSPIYSDAAGQMAFEDITGLQMLEIVTLALKEDIAPFFSGLVSLVLGTPVPTSE